MTIIVGANESACGLASLLKAHWDYVAVRRLKVGDVAIGENVLIQRKTVADYLASLADGRLFRQARQLSTASRPLFIREGDPESLRAQKDTGALRGVELAITVGFRIPILTTVSLEDTAEVFLTTFGTFEDGTPPLPFVDIARAAEIPLIPPLQS